MHPKPCEPNRGSLSVVCYWHFFVLVSRSAHCDGTLLLGCGVCLVMSSAAAALAFTFVAASHRVVLATSGKRCSCFCSFSSGCCWSHTLISRGIGNRLCNANHPSSIRSLSLLTCAAVRCVCCCFSGLCYAMCFNVRLWWLAAETLIVRAGCVTSDVV